MNKFVKAGIRLDKIHQRNLKPHYSHLTAVEKRMVKAMEAVEQCEREMRKAEVSGEANWRNTEWGRDLLGRYFKAIQRRDRVREKNGVDFEKAEELLASTKTTRFYGGNY
jgi:hypothetical protein